MHRGPYSVGAVQFGVALPTGGECGDPRFLVQLAAGVDWWVERVVRADRKTMRAVVVRGPLRVD